MSPPTEYDCSPVATSSTGSVITTVSVKRVKISPVAEGDPHRAEPDRAGLLAFADVEFVEGLVIHGVRLIQKVLPDGAKTVFLDFPSIPLPSPERCACGRNIDCIAKYCSKCGRPNYGSPLQPGKPRYRNMVHPISHACRQVIHSAVLAAYMRHRSELATQNGTVYTAEEAFGVGVGTSDDHTEQSQ